MFNHGTAPRLGWPLYFQIPPFQEQLLCNLSQGREEKAEIQDESLVASYPRTACTVGSTKERNASSICDGVKRLRRSIH